MRLGLLALCSLIVMCLVGCGGSTIDGPSTPVEILSIGAKLPGTDWHKVSGEKLGTLDSERWENADGSLFYRVSADMDNSLSVPSVDTVGVDYFMNLLDYPTSTIQARNYFVGRSALRLEAVGDVYHSVEYVFVAGFHQFYVGAGATNTTWDKSGKDTVEAILNTVTNDITK